MQYSHYCSLVWHTGPDIKVSALGSTVGWTPAKNERMPTIDFALIELVLFITDKK